MRGLRKVGCTVAITNAVGGGFPDLVVGYRMETTLLELKDPMQPPNKRRLTPAQEEFHREWRGKPIRVVETLAEAFDAVGVTNANRRDAGYVVEDPMAFDSANVRYHP